jgi:uncharacterized metal-binding protein YceD (DUF177 family)
VGSDRKDAATVFRVADLPRRRETSFDLVPDAGTRADLAAGLGATSIDKLRLAGSLRPSGTADWTLEAELSATVEQPCSVTLAPVTTRLNEDVLRRFVADIADMAAPGSETEMPEDDSIEPLGREIDLQRVLSEALALALPAYPRAPEAELGPANFAAPGTTPLTDETAHPFAGLAALKKVPDKKD